MASKSLRNIIVVGGSFVGRVSLSSNDLPNANSDDYCSDYRAGAGSSYPSDA